MFWFMAKQAENSGKAEESARGLGQTQGRR
jgi:hypothetical protein